MIERTVRNKCKATEKLSFEEALAGLPRAEAHVKTLLTCLRQIKALPKDSTILDVGSASGRFLIACAKRGCTACGVEPWIDARDMAQRLAMHEGVKVQILPGVAEELPFSSEAFDVVHAASVIEHVRDAQTAFDEAYRVLKPGGVFWFFTASSMCPRQDEIRGFPLFGWYPDALKRRIMEWAKTNRPRLIGHTGAPAINWFTPWKARRMLHKSGFSRVYDRWDLARPLEPKKVVRMVLGMIRLCFITKLCADMLVRGCAYVAVK